MPWYRFHKNNRSEEHQLEVRWHEIWKQIFKNATVLADGGNMINCNHGPAIMSLDDYRKTGKTFCIKQLLQSATAEYQADYGVEVHIDDFIAAVELETRKGFLQKTPQKHYRFDPSHPFNQMSKVERVLYLGAGDDAF
jgi:hypothetical protein